MALQSLTAVFSCDECGAEFTVKCDPAITCESLFEGAEEACMGGNGCTSGICSFQDGQHLCPSCTTERDAVAEE
jgi:hypothetical protein